MCCRHELPGIDKLRIGATNAVADVLVELGTEAASDVVGLEAGQHGYELDAFRYLSGSGLRFSNLPALE